MTSVSSTAHWLSSPGRSTPTPARSSISSSSTTRCRPPWPSIPGQLNDAITQLAGASSGLVSLLVPNLQPLEADVGTVTTVGRTLDRNLSSVDEILQNGNNLFQGAKRAYDPTYDWLNLNLATAPG